VFVIFSYQLSAISFQLSAFSHQLSAISFQLSAFSYQLSAISFQPKQEAEGREPIACTLAQSHCNPL
jgi:hypothetical protein